MNVLLNPLFWIAVIAVHLVMHVAPSNARGLTFGALNVIVLAAVVGWRAALAVSVIALLLWAALRSTVALRSRDAALMVGSAGIAAALVALFVCYKLSREHPQLWASAAAGLAPLRVDLVTSALAAISFSYVFLRGLDLTMAVATGTELLNPISLLGYLAPFHMLAAGPIGSYRDHVSSDQPPASDASFRDLVGNLNEITTGLFYKFVIAESLKIFAYGVNGRISAPASLAGTMFLLVYLFFDFAGYSRIALGIGRLCGIPTPVNFNAPLLATSVTNFWTRWHMSLGAFVLRNIYTPLQLGLTRRLGAVRAHWVSLLTLLVSFAFVGLWHRLSLPFLLWGLGMGGIMFVEKRVRDYALRVPSFQGRPAAVALQVIGPVYVFLVLSLSLRFVMAELIGV